MIFSNFIMQSKEDLSMGSEICLTPYVQEFVYDRVTYSAYIPYVATEELRANAQPSGLIAIYLGVSPDRADYSISYTYSYSKDVFEIGFTGGDLEKVFATIKYFQALLESRGGTVDSEIDIIVYRDIISDR
jgi:hypothetical protein